jgi:hypothetical protein
VLCQSQSYFTTAGSLPISSSCLQAPWDSWYSNFIFLPNSCGCSPYVRSFLMREWVCHLKLQLVFASAVILGSESRGTHGHILLSQICDSPHPGGPGLYIYIPPGTGWPSYTSRHWVHFFSPPTIRRATVEVFDLASTWEKLFCWHSVLIYIYFIIVFHFSFIMKPFDDVLVLQVLKVISKCRWE